LLVAEKKHKLSFINKSFAKKTIIDILLQIHWVTSLPLTNDDIALLISNNALFAGWKIFIQTLTADIA